MGIARSLAAWLFFLSLVLLAPMSVAGEASVLVDGSRAVLVEKQLILIHGDGKRTIARPGHYDTRDGRYTFVVRPNEVVVRDHTKERR